MEKKFRDYNQQQLFLLPPDIRDWVPQEHLARFINDVVETLDLRPFRTTYRGRRGRPPYRPAMMLKVLLYSFCTGTFSSRKIEKATYDDVPTRFLAANQHPDHASFCNFRRRHYEAILNFFTQCVALCRELGICSLGHVAIDGTLMKANASKERGVKVSELDELIAKDEELIRDLLEKWKAADDEDVPDELPEELRKAEDRIAKLKRAKEVVERKAQKRHEKKLKELEAREQVRQENYQRKREESVISQEGPGPRETRQQMGLSLAQVGNATRMSRQRVHRLELGYGYPSEEERAALEEFFRTSLSFPRTGPSPRRPKPLTPPKRDYPEYVNLTDPESSFIVRRRRRAIQGYNPQIAVDSDSQVIVGCFVTNSHTDHENLIPMVNEVCRVNKSSPQQVSADSSYFSSDKIAELIEQEIDPYIPPQHCKTIPKAPRKLAQQMREKVRIHSKGVYSKRAATVEPVFGRIKCGLGFRKFLTRGLENTNFEWTMVATAHNLLKLFKSWG